jgi:hypothetical protein
MGNWWAKARVHADRHSSKAQRQAWLQKLQGAGREEASRPIEEHRTLQAKLQMLGYLPATAKIDGIYGHAAWQTASQLPATGLLRTNDGIALSQSRPRAASRTETIFSVTRRPLSDSKHDVLK